MIFALPDYEPQTQQIALPYEDLYAEVKRHRSWRGPSVDGGVSDGWSVAHSTGLVCPVCTRTWAILAFADEELSFRASCCRDHIGKGSSRYPRFDACIVLDIGAEGYGLIDYPLLWALPMPLLKREFDLHLQQIQGDCIGSYSRPYGS